MTLEEFLVWNSDDPSGASWELVDGEAVAMAPATERHAATMGEVGRRVANHLLDSGSSCRLLIEPGIVPHVRANSNVRIPDLGVTCAPPSDDIIVRDPVLLIEILSPNNEAQTRSNVWTYTTIPSVREILAIHSTRIESELLIRRPDGNWPEMPDIVAGEGVVSLPSISFSAPLAAFYRTTTLAR
jgi:Uma2 family endonuclease